MSSKKADEPKKDTGNGSDELTAVVEELLDSLSNKFTTVSSEIFAKMDDMTRRLDSLESALQANEEKLSNAASKQQ
ncbi:heat shock factor binding protein 1-domain-containing protein [Annulohypoxylon bovei var. microspora]|nr:heat shock factor binding protein 1-domain-containing protein [Annulohypoxylon bovei var. microspora]